ncbi:autotransporter outer membrane beta-barrel domain-containing protein [Bartonella taylorii]|uniref:autotransporter outer membrane beta-barrel domain-containing protein n=1 Tax=Bartonella taylorii TaxID=33046 RepID=UPI001FEECFB7|nr:autotransporter outer membrane beta-barrel domain-containing protein [Bartonella taylorii]
MFSGNVFTLARSKTGENSLSGSLATGKAFRIGYESFVLDRQIQFVYQHLRFRKTHGVDGFDIDMRKPDYWMMRVGGRLTKTLAVIEKARVLSFYSQFHFIRNFDNEQFVYFGDTFLLGDFGSSLETGFGVYAHLSSKITFHSNLIYSINLPRLFL